MSIKSVLSGGLLFVLIVPAVHAQTAVTTTGGTTNAIPKYSGSSTLVSSAITEASGKVGIRNSVPNGTLDVVTASDTTGNPSAFGPQHFVVGAGIASGAGSGGVFTSYDQTNNRGFIGALSPNIAWRSLSLQPIAGNVGVGIASPVAPFQIGAWTSIQTPTVGQSAFSFNTYFDGTNWRYINAGLGTSIRTWNNNIYFHTLASGAAGTIASTMDTTGPKLVLFNSGGLALGNSIIGTDPGAGNLNLSGTIKAAGVVFGDGTTLSTASALNGVTIGATTPASVNATSGTFTSMALNTNVNLGAFTVTESSTSPTLLPIQINAASMPVGGYAGISTGQSLTAGNSSQYYWVKDGSNVGHAYLGTYGAGSPIALGGSFVGVTGSFAVNNGATYNGLGFTCGTGIAFCVNPSSSTVAPFTVNTSGNTVGHSFSDGICVITGGIGTGCTLASPALTGLPTGPTAASGTNTSQLATTAFVKTAVGAGVTLPTDIVYTDTAQTISGQKSFTSNVGIGTTAPQGQLSNNSTNYGDNSSGTSSGSFNWYHNATDTGWNAISSAGSNGLVVATDQTNGAAFQVSSGTYNTATANRANHLFTVLGTGKVGIGTISPITTLHINSNGAAVSGYGLMLGQLSYGGNTTVANGVETTRFEIAFPGFRDVQPNQVGAKIAAIRWNNYSSGNALVQATDLAFFTGTGSYGANTSSLIDTSFEKMRITAAGNVGIGTTTPSMALEVNGNVRLTANSGGSITFQDNSMQSVAWTGILSGGDYAESVDVVGDRAEYEPGDVLVVDPSSDGRFIKSTAPYSTSVMGIYSTRPGVVGRRQTSGRSHMIAEIPMAMIGIVPTKVCAEGGAIRPGDLLVTSSRPGYAMKGTDRSQLSGAIVGKALGHLDSGTGTLEVAVSLQ